MLFLSFLFYIPIKQINHKSFTFNKMSSTRTKRTYSEAFGQHSYETEKYNQEITEDYFMKGGTGHGVYVYNPEKSNQYKPTIMQDIIHMKIIIKNNNKK